MMRPDRTGVAAMFPYRWTARPSGVSLCSEKCVRGRLVRGAAQFLTKLGRKKPGQVKGAFDLLVLSRLLPSI
jgi:hypothetical protein